MARTASNPLPQFITSPDLGAVIAAELHEHADREAKILTERGEGVSALGAVRLQAIRNAACQLDDYCRGAVTAR